MSMEHCFLKNDEIKGYTKYKAILKTKGQIYVLVKKLWQTACFKEFATVSKRDYIFAYALIAQNKLCGNCTKLTTLAIFKLSTLHKVITGKIYIF